MQLPNVALTTALLLVAVLIGGCGADVRDVDSTSTPTPGTSPSASGLHVTKMLASLQALDIERENLHHIIVVRNGVTIIDHTSWPATIDAPHDIASATKSVVSLVVGALIEQGEITSLDATLGDLLDVEHRPGVMDVTLRSLLGMRSGLACSAGDGERQLREMQAAADPVGYALSLPAGGLQGEQFAYCSPNYHLISAAIASTTGRSLADNARRVLFDPLAIDGWLWPSDAQGVTHGWGDLALRPRDLARIGQLLLEDGRMSGHRLLPEGFVTSLHADSVSAGPNQRYGLGWWLSVERFRGAMAASGRGGQFLFVWPERDLVVAINGASIDARPIAYAIADAVHDGTTADKGADDALAAFLQTLRRRGEPGEISAPSSGALLDTTFALQDNPIGIRTIAVEVNGAEAVVDIEIAERLFHLVVGLDGVARLTEQSPSGGPVALAGRWSGPKLHIDYEATNAPEHLDITLDVSGNDGAVVLALRDHTGALPPLDLTGTVVD